MTDKNNAEIIIEKLGNSNPWIADQLDIDRVTVWHWKKTGNIPHKYHKRLIELGVERGVEITYAEFISQ